MLGFIAKKLIQQQLVSSSINGYKAAIFHRQSSKFKPFHYSTVLKSSTSIQSDSKGDPFTVSYLVNSCGFSVDALNLIRSYGFTDAQISTIVTVSPYVLHSDPVNNLKPKFDLFTSLGASNESLLKIIRVCPEVLRISLEQNIVPALDIISSIVGSNEELITLLTRFRILHHDSFRTLGPNVALLRYIGMTDACISRFLMLNGYPFTLEPAKFGVLAERALAMGFNVETNNFGSAMNVLALSEEKWEKKVKIFMKWGWSESEFRLAFRKQPRIMQASEARMDKTMHYYINLMGLEGVSLARNPHVLLYSLEKRIIPRCYVVQNLLYRGLIKKDYCLNSVLVGSDEYFLKAFVEKHSEDSSDLLSIYHSLKH